MIQATHNPLFAFSTRPTVIMYIAPGEQQNIVPLIGFTFARHHSLSSSIWIKTITGSKDIWTSNYYHNLAILSRLGGTRSWELHGWSKLASRNQIGFTLTSGEVSNSKDFLKYDMAVGMSSKASALTANLEALCASATWAGGGS